MRNGLEAKAGPAEGRRLRATAASAAPLDALPDPSLLLDPAGLLQASNSAWDRFCERDAPQGLRISLGDSFPDACAALEQLGGPVRDALARLLACQLPHFAHEYTLPTGAGLKHYALIASPLPDGGALITHRDISRRKSAEESSAQLNDQRLAERHYYEELLADAPAVLWDGSCRSDGSELHMHFISRYVETLLGYALGEWLTNPGFFTRIIHPDDRQRVEQDLGEVARGGRGGEFEFRCVTRDADIRWIHCQVTVSSPRDAAAVHLRGVCTDITARRQSEESLRQRAAELGSLARSLKRSNEELDQYAYITSHDLKAPLRGIANLSRWIEEDLGPVVTDDAHRQLDRLRGRVHRMESLIEAILAYSRVGRVRTTPETIDTGRMVRDVVELLSPPAGFRIDIAPDMPVLVGERPRLQQVFMNLLSNAIKHHHDPAHGRVTVSAREAGDSWEFAVEDDGPGIDPAYHQKIFVIFQTLKPRDKVEGTGVGLSLVKKIVEDQGGAVRLDSAPGRGSRFSFTWRKDIRSFRPSPQ